MKVRAKSFGFFANRKQKAGAVFECSEKEFSKQWMEKIGDDGKPLKEGGKEAAEEPKEIAEADKPKRGRPKSSGDVEVI